MPCATTAVVSEAAADCICAASVPSLSVPYVGKNEP